MRRENAMVIGLAAAQRAKLEKAGAKVGTGKACSAGARA